MVLRKIMKYFIILDHPRNISKIDLNAPPKSVLGFKTVKNQWNKNVSGTISVLWKNMKPCKIFDHLKTPGKLNLIGLPKEFNWSS